jgi:hypothetical protein
MAPTKTGHFQNSRIRARTACFHVSITRTLQYYDSTGIRFIVDTDSIRDRATFPPDVRLSMRASYPRNESKGQADLHAQIDVRRDLDCINLKSLCFQTRCIYQLEFYA